MAGRSLRSGRSHPPTGYVAHPRGVSCRLTLPPGRNLLHPALHRPLEGRVLHASVDELARMNNGRMVPAQHVANLGIGGVRQPAQKPANDLALERDMLRPPWPEQYLAFDM